MTDSIELLTGVSIVIVTPALVEVAKQIGLAVRWAGVAAIIFATVLLVLGDLATGAEVREEAVARWIIGGVVYGLAAAGLYTQTRIRDDDRTPSMA